MIQHTQTQDLRPILQSMEESWHEFIAEVKSVPPDDFCRDPGDGEWSVKRQVEHCIGSEVYFASLVMHAMGVTYGREWERDRLRRIGGSAGKDSQFLGGES